MAKGLVKKRLGEAFGDCGPRYLQNVIGICLREDKPTVFHSP